MSKIKGLSYVTEGTEFCAFLGPHQFDCPFALTDYLIKYNGTELFDQLLEVLKDYGSRMIEQEQYEIMPELHQLFDDVDMMYRTGVIF